MKNKFFSCCTLVSISLTAHSQTADNKLSEENNKVILIKDSSSSNRPNGETNNSIFFVSDTQQPMMVEKILLKPNHNLQATALLLSEIINKNPGHLYMLGDVVGLGKSNRKWKHIDKFLDTCRRQGTTVCGLLGNHEVMFNKKKGERNFTKRFPMNVNTGYVSVADSVAVVLLNSNFSTLSAAERQKQQDWYESTLKNLDAADSIRAVIVTCHHAPFSNSKVVSSSASVQQYFVPAYIQSKKAQLFITGHAHAYEHFKKMGKDFLVIGGGGGLHQPLNNSASALTDEAADYKPMFHYLCVKRDRASLLITSHFLDDKFSSFGTGQSFAINPPAVSSTPYVIK